MEIKEGYTRVSSILGQWNSFAHINKDVLANKCRIGTNVHAKIAAEMDGIFLDLEPDEEGYYESWEKLKKEIDVGVEVHQAEQRFYCDELMITGCVDAIIQRVGSTEHSLVDWKTSAAPNLSIWSRQLTFYRYLVNRHRRLNSVTYNPVSSLAYVVLLKKDGKIPKIYEINCDEETWLACYSALISYRFKPNFKKIKTLDICQQLTHNREQ